MRRPYFVLVFIFVSALVGGVVGLLVKSQLDYKQRAEVAEAKVAKAAAFLDGSVKPVMEESLKALEEARDTIRDNGREIARLRAAKPTLDAVRRAWGMEGRLECAVVPLGSARAVSETFLAR